MIAEGSVVFVHVGVDGVEGAKKWVIQRWYYYTTVSVTRDPVTCWAAMKSNFGLTIQIPDVDMARVMMHHAFAQALVAHILLGAHRASAPLLNIGPDRLRQRGQVYSRKTTLLRTVRAYVPMVDRTYVST